jgi:hypothetical protein
MKKHRVTLTVAERDALGRLLARGKADARKLKHARILLKADPAEGGPAWADERIVAALDVGVATVPRLRRRFVEEGLQAALRPYRVGRRLYQRKLDGELEAKRIARACSTPPDERGRWTLRLLAELKHVDTLSHETVRQTRKKTRSSRT